MTAGLVLGGTAFLLWRASLLAMAVSQSTNVFTEPNDFLSKPVSTKVCTNLPDTLLISS
jgi:hypothetical protein